MSPVVRNVWSEILRATDDARTWASETAAYAGEGGNRTYDWTRRVKCYVGETVERGQACVHARVETDEDGNVSASGSVCNAYNLASKRAETLVDEHLANAPAPGEPPAPPLPARPDPAEVRVS